jgi:hypothetical protein
MFTVLIWMLVNLITWIIKKTGISGTYLSIILSFVWWLVYFYFTEFNQQWLDTLIYYISGIYATSQIVYNLLIKLEVFPKSS